MEKTRLLLLTAALLSALAALPASSLKYHSYNEVEKLFRSLESTHPRLAKLHSIGQSVQKRELYVLQVRIMKWA